MLLPVVLALLLITALSLAVIALVAVPARREDLAGLPPAWIGVGDIELFYEEGRRYAERLIDAGVPTALEVVPGAPHAFESFLGGTGFLLDQGVMG